MVKRLNKQQKKELVKEHYSKHRLIKNPSEFESIWELRKEAYMRSIDNNTTSSLVRIQSEYNLSPEEYLNMFKFQDYKCIICNKPISPLSRKSHVDHNHKTNKVRGILCSNCNSGLGMFNEDIDSLNRAILYLILDELYNS